MLRLYPRLTSGNQFGMDEDTVLEILKKAKELPGIEAEGIHYFSGTQKKNLKRHQKELAYLDEFLKKAAEEQIDVRCLEYGSGTAVPYFRDKTAETFEKAGLKGLPDAVKGMQWKGPRRVTAFIIALLTGAVISSIMTGKSRECMNRM